MEALTLDRVKALAAEVVEEFGKDYVYPEEHRRWNTGTHMCVYVHEGNPSCMVGQILARHGVSTEQLSRFEFRGAWNVASNLVPGTSESALRYLDRLQGKQDEGFTWGESMESAHGLLGN